MRKLLTAVLLSGWFAAATVSAEDLVIQSLDSNGRVMFNRVTNWVGYKADKYRIEWASSATGSWRSFTAASAALDDIAAPGSDVATNYVPMFYRVVATVSRLATAAPPNMVLIPAGTFTMGDSVGDGGGGMGETPVHTVTVSSFYMDRYEVSKALWDEVKAWSLTNGYTYCFNVETSVAPDHPAVYMNWYDAVKWCNARSEKEGWAPVYYSDSNFTQVARTGSTKAFAKWDRCGYRLPTEAEWEYAARGGLSGKRFPWGDTITHSQANYVSTNAYAYDTSATRGYHPSYASNTCPVDAMGPQNAYGLYHVAGNAAEWVWDAGSTYQTNSVTDPHGPDFGGGWASHVFRGGEYPGDACVARVSYRNCRGSDSSALQSGFRTVMPTLQ